MNRHQRSSVSEYFYWKSQLVHKLRICCLLGRGCSWQQQARIPEIVRLDTVWIFACENEMDWSIWCGDVWGHCWDTQLVLWPTAFRCHPRLPSSRCLAKQSSRSSSAVRVLLRFTHITVFAESSLVLSTTPYAASWLRSCVSSWTIQEVFIDQERKLGGWRWSDIVLVLSLNHKPCHLEIGGCYLHDSFSTLWEINIFGFRGEYGRKAET